jgi:hypothetical protein
MNYEALQQQTRVEFGRRLKVLSADVAAWTPADRLQNMGLSEPQRLALVNLLQDLDRRQKDAFFNLDKDLPAPKFADGKADLMLQMTGAQELWQVFRNILDQHEDQITKTAVRAATRVAGDCYQMCIRRARRWHAIPEERLREQPLVFLEAVESPATAGRSDQVRLISSSIRQWREVKLPLPIALLPFDYSQSIWTFCAIHHEVGHNLDQDLDLSPELRGSLFELLGPKDKMWRRWSKEILADVFGLVLAGVGFALSMAALALTLGPATQFKQLDEQAEHPPLLLRLRLLSEMLLLTKVPGLVKWGNDLREAWDAASKPDWLGPFSEDAPKVAEHFLTSNIANLKDHSMLEFNPDLAAEHGVTDQLASFFLTGKNRPVPSKDDGMHPRLVPAAAQMALRRSEQPTAAVLEQLQVDALKYLDLIPPVAHLAAPVVDAASRREYLQSLVMNIDFRSVGSVRREPNEE